ncbi:MAG: IPT/TIG domain-containing protein [bacterium]|nr:IPT/TIG domain-containing protein [bacterium]
MARIIKSAFRRKKFSQIKKSIRPLILPVILLTSALALSAHIIVKGLPRLLPEDPGPGVPVILSVSPNFGSTGTKVKIEGRFFAEDSVVIFGADNEMPGFIIPERVIKNGERIEFVVPENLNLCPPDAEENSIPCPPVSLKANPGSYTIQIQTSLGVSNDARFSVIGD